MATKEKIVEETEDDEDAAVAVDPEAAAKKKKLIMLGGIGVVLLLLAGGGTWFALGLLSDKPATEEAATADAEHEAEKGAHEEAHDTGKKPAAYASLDPAFLANFSVGGRQRYLQVSLAALARDEKANEALRAHMPLVRNRIVMLLSGESFEQLQTDDGRAQLQQKLLAAIQEILKKETGEPGIEQVFFTQFVMQ
jgi:flagellar protein FliL